MYCPWIAEIDNPTVNVFIRALHIRLVLRWETIPPALVVGPTQAWPIRSRLLSLPEPKLPDSESPLLHLTDSLQNSEHFPKTYCVPSLLPLLLNLLLTTTNSPSSKLSNSSQAAHLFYKRKVLNIWPCSLQRKPELMTIAVDYDKPWSSICYR